MVDAIVSFAVERLGDSLIQEVVSLHGVKDEVVSLQRELNLMRSSLEDAEQKQDGDSTIRVWVSEIQDIAYDTEDVIETFIFKLKEPIQTSRREMLSNFVRNCFCICTIADRYGIGKEIKALKNRVLAVKRTRETYGINNIGGGVQEGSSSNACYLRDLRITTPYADEDVVGFKDDAQSLQEKLLWKGVISILGMGGLGKTTLARKLYNNNCINFDLHAWVCVSEEWNTRDLFERLIKSFKGRLTKDELEMLEKMKDYDMREYLRNLLEGRKYLVVIDDMWQKEAWQSLRRALPDNQNGSRIIITTRKESVAELSDETYKLRFLRKDESWKLFCKKVFPENNDACPPDMETLGKQMVAKCGGLPLAIIVLSGLLSRKQFHEWHVVKERIWRELKNDSSNISLLLALSYNDLSHELKSCFLYLSLFPEDSIIDVKKLTRMWVAEQFITQEGGGGLDDLEEVAENYLKELIRRSLIQVVGRNWRMVTRCRVHDLLRDLAVNKANELNFLHIYNEALNSAPLNVACRRISFHSDFESRASFDHLGQRVRTISYNGFYSEKEMVINLVSKFGLLRVLDIKRVRFNEKAELRFGKAVGKLIHLRYLGLYKTGIDKFPKSIGNCQALRTLDFDTHRIVMLPTSIKKLKQLRHLSGLFDGSPLLFEELTNLQCLQEVDIGDWLHQQKGNEFALNAFGKLINLRVLSLLLLGGGNSHLVSVDPLLKCRHLIELKIAGGIKKLPEEMHKFLPNLKYLNLQYSRLEQDPMPALEMLPNLLVLLLDSVLVEEKIKIMTITATGFPQLEYLSLSTYVGSSIKLQVEEGGMPRLRALDMRNDENLKRTLSERLRSIPGRYSLKWDWD